MPAWVELYCATAAGWALVLIGEWLVSFKDANIPYSWVGSLPRLHGLSVESSFIAFYLVPPTLPLPRGQAQIWAIPIILALVLTTSRYGGHRRDRRSARPARRGRPLASDRRRQGGARRRCGGGRARRSGHPELPADRHDPGRDPADEARLGSKAKRIDEDFLTLNDTSSTALRVQSVKDAVATYRQAPLTGVGIGAYGQASHERGAYVEVPTSLVLAMSLWFEALAELGPLGLLALLVWVFAPVPFLWRLRASAPLAVPLIVAILASAAMLLAAQTWWVPYRWIRGSSPTRSLRPCSPPRWLAGRAGLQSPSPPSRGRARRGRRRRTPTLASATARARDA